MTAATALDLLDADLRDAALALGAAQREEWMAFTALVLTNCAITHADVIRSPTTGSVQLDGRTRPCRFTLRDVQLDGEQMTAPADQLELFARVGLTEADALIPQILWTAPTDVRHRPEPGRRALRSGDLRARNERAELHLLVEIAGRTLRELDDNWQLCVRRAGTLTVLQCRRSELDEWQPSDADVPTAMSQLAVTLNALQLGRAIGLVEDLQCDRFGVRFHRR